MILIHDSDTNDKTQDTVILWMKEILHHLGWMKPYK